MSDREISPYEVINYSYNKIPNEILAGIDTVYIDPPYFKKDTKNSEYLSYYHFMEGFVDYETWNEKINQSSINLTLKEDAEITINSAYEMFVNIVEKFQNKNLVISYKIDAYPTIQEIETIIRTRYKNVIINYIDYKYALSKNLTKEVVILATNDHRQNSTAVLQAGGI